MNLSDLFDLPEFHDLPAEQKAAIVREHLPKMGDDQIVALLCSMIRMERVARRTRADACTAGGLEVMTCGSM